MALVRLISEEYDGAGFYKKLDVDTPQLALASLHQVLSFGVQKHGPFDPKQYVPFHFWHKHGRHMERSGVDLQALDESGQPHIIHAAADLLLAWECTQNKR
jgi:hypothetical protein